jgi:ABC-type sugar transport system ATPase subunit
VDVELIGIEKRYPGVQALRGVDLHLRAGEVHALVGQNGAGKSTLIKVLTGAVAPDAGEISVAGDRVRFHSPADAEGAGIAVVHQEPQLFPQLSVAENVLVAHPPTRFAPPFRMRDRRRTRRRAAELLERLGIHVDVRAPAGTLAPAERKLIEVARALAADARVVLLDEPTAALERGEVERLFALMRRLCAGGAAVLFVSHKLEEVIAVSTRVTALRDGSVVAHAETSEVTLRDLIHAVAAGELRELPSFESEIGAAVLRAREVEAGALGPVDFEASSGEIVSLTGLLGSGAAAFGRAVAGARGYERGEVTFAGGRLPAGNRAAAAERGLGFVAEDRKAEGIVPELSVEKNIALGAIKNVSRFGFLSRRRMREHAQELMATFDIRPRIPSLPAGSLSGGNQQKLLLARWVAARSSVLVLEEPTHGVDVGAKAEVNALLRRFAADGGTIVLVSRETAELLELSDRVGVFREGRLVATLPRGATEREIAAYTHGVAGTDAA